MEILQQHRQILDGIKDDIAAYEGKKANLLAAVDEIEKDIICMNHSISLVLETGDAAKLTELAKLKKKLDNKLQEQEQVKDMIAALDAAARADISNKIERLIVEGAAPRKAEFEEVKVEELTEFMELVKGQWGIFYRLTDKQNQYREIEEEAFYLAKEMGLEAAEKNSVRRLITYSGYLDAIPALSDAQKLMYNGHYPDTTQEIFLRSEGIL